MHLHNEFQLCISNLYFYPSILLTDISVYFVHDKILVNIHQNIESDCDVIKYLRDLQKKNDVMQQQCLVAVLDFYAEKVIQKLMYIKLTFFQNC